MLAHLLQFPTTSPTITQQLTMPIPLVFGKSKIKLLSSRNRNEEQGRGHTHDMSFAIEEESTSLPAPSFNLLYVQTPKIEALQTPEFQVLAQVWSETVELVKPLLRFGFPETSLRTKCPYYDENLYATSSGSLLANDRLRKVMTGIQRGYITPHTQQHHGSSSSHHQQHPQPEHISLQQSSSSSVRQDSSSPLGIGNLGFLGLSGHNHQPHYRHHEMIRKSQLLVPELPSGTLVLALNLMAYWLITKQASRA